MEKLIDKMSRTDFSTEHHSSKIIRSNNHDCYMLHNVDIINEIVVEGVKLTAIYQTANSFIGNDYNAPSSDLELSREAETHPFLLAIDELTEDEIDSLDECEIEDLRSLIGFCFLNHYDVRKFYEFLNENLTHAISEFNNINLDNDVDNWIDGEDLAEHNNHDDMLGLAMHAPFLSLLSIEASDGGKDQSDISKEVERIIEEKNINFRFDYEFKEMESTLINDACENLEWSCVPDSIVLTANWDN